jgi:protein-disulfide isomerase
MPLTPPVTSSDHIRGGADWTVTLVEYGDYECPACGQAHLVVKQLQSLLGSQLRFVFRNFPLKNTHPHAEEAAWLAEGARSAGEFWGLHDLLFESQGQLDRSSLARYGIARGMSQAQVKAALSGIWHRKVADDFGSGVRSGVTGTPTFFIDGKRFDGDWSLPGLLQALEAAAA